MKFKNRFNQKYKLSPTVFGNNPMPVVEKALEYVSEGTALDIGAGNGRNTLYLLSKPFHVTGVDMSKEGIDLLRERSNDHEELELVVSDVLKFETDKQFDLVLAIGLLHFLEKKDIVSLIKKIKEWTKVGGLNVIATRMVQNLRNDLPYVFKEDELKSFYDDPEWEIKEYQEADSRRAKIASLIAQKNK